LRLTAIKLINNIYSIKKQPGTVNINVDVLLHEYVEIRDK